VKFVRSSIALAVAAGLSACNGGGSSGGSNTLGSLVRPSVPFHAPVRINSFQPHHQPYEYRTPGPHIFVHDLNGDGADEVLWSNVAFDWTGTNWINSQVQIFGNNTGSFQNETGSWFREGDNVYAGGFKINFGKFTGSRFDDVFLATFTDTPNHTGPSVLLVNTVTQVGGVSAFTRRLIDFGVNLHSHDSVTADFNGDGLDDVLVTGSGLMLGSSTGNHKIYLTPPCCEPGSVAGAGISAADYLGDGTVTVVVTDGPGDGGLASDTILYRPRIENDQLVMQHIATLPTDRFWLPKWQSLRDTGVIHGHAVRNIAMDFDRDGKPDVVVFSTAEKDGNVHGWTEVQFLRNDGDGQFTDVTDTVLTGFDHGKTVSYNPQLIDVNNDGLLDIFMSATDYTGQSSTSVLLATREGGFVESYVQIFDAFNQQLRDLVGPTAGNNQPIAIVQGPDNTRYLVSGVEYQQDGRALVAVYASLIGTQGTVNAQATLDLVQQTWPWMSAAEANTVLARTATSNLDGITVIDWDRIWRPMGNLSLDINGDRRILSGYIMVPGFDAGKLLNITALDDLGRDFQVDLSVMAAQSDTRTADRLLATDNPRQDWGSRFVGANVTENRGFSVTAGSPDSYAINVSTQRLGFTQAWDVKLGMASMSGSPWMSFSGVFGRLRDSVMIDATLSRDWANGVFVQGNLMRTTTNFDPGLIDNITPLWSGAFITGWQNQIWSLYGGVQPTIFSGSMSMTLPRAVDRLGETIYARHKLEIRNHPVTFIGVQRQWSYQKSRMVWSAAINNTGSKYARLNFHKDF
jgi:hypothetical protein